MPNPKTACKPRKSKHPSLKNIEAQKAKLDPTKGKQTWIVSLAGPKGGGRIVLKANTPGMAATKATYAIFGKRKGLKRTPKGTEAIVSRETTRKGVTSQYFYEY